MVDKSLATVHKTFTCNVAVNTPKEWFKTEVEMLVFGEWQRIRLINYGSDDVSIYWKTYYISWKVQIWPISTDVVSSSKEVKVGYKATLTCTLSGLSSVTTTIKWQLDTTIWSAIDNANHPDYLIRWKWFAMKDEKHILTLLNRVFWQNL